MNIAWHRLENAPLFLPKNAPQYCSRRVIQFLENNYIHGRAMALTAEAVAGVRVATGVFALTPAARVRVTTTEVCLKQGPGSDLKPIAPPALVHGAPVDTEVGAEVSAAAAAVAVALAVAGTTIIPVIVHRAPLYRFAPAADTDQDHGHIVSGLFHCLTRAHAHVHTCVLPFHQEMMNITEKTPHAL